MRTSSLTPEMLADYANRGGTVTVVPSKITYTRDGEIDTRRFREVPVLEHMTFGEHAALAAKHGSDYAEQVRCGTNDDNGSADQLAA